MILTVLDVLNAQTPKLVNLGTDGDVILSNVAWLIIVIIRVHLHGEILRDGKVTNALSNTASRIVPKLVLENKGNSVCTKLILCSKVKSRINQEGRCDIDLQLRPDRSYFIIIFLGESDTPVYIGTTTGTDTIVVWLGDSWH
jgi:hypothetical protein